MMNFEARQFNWRAHGLRALAATLVLSCSAAAYADKVVGTWTAVFQGVDYMTGYETGLHYAGETGVRRLEVNAMRIDLRDSGINFMSTPSNGVTAGDTNSQTTGSFLEQNHLQVAVNANFFSPCCSATSQPKDLLGLAISQGQVVSGADFNSIPPGGTADSLVITSDNHAAITHVTPSSDISSFYTAVSAGPVLVNSGQIAVNQVPADSFAAANPRTAVGLSADGSFMYLLTLDGRRPGISDGATLYESAGWLLTLGAFQALNLDGGGSTNLVMADANGAATYLNIPSGGDPRLDGNSLGLYAQALAPVPEPSTTLMLALGIMTLIGMRVKRQRSL